MQHLIKESWLFPFIESIHIVGLIILVGTIALVDFRLLGLGFHRISPLNLARQLAPWTSCGLITMFTTGPLMFWSDSSRYLNNPAFLMKMALLAIALIAHVALHRPVRLATRSRKWTAVLSLVLWSCVVLAGRAIADFDLRPA